MKHTRLFTFIVTAPVIFVMIGAALISVYTIMEHTRQYETTMKTVESKYVEYEQSRIKNSVVNIASYIDFKLQWVERQIKQRLTMRIDNAQRLAMKIYNEHKGQWSEQRIKQEIIKTISSLSWHNGESYIWVVDYAGVVRSVPDHLSSIQNKNILDFKDATGREIIKEEIALAKENGQGFLYDTFLRPNKHPNKQYRQIAYVKRFEPFNWYFGTAEFIDDSIKEVQAEVIERIHNTHVINNSYFFVLKIFDKNGGKDFGEFLANQNLPQLVGMKVSDNIVDPKGNMFFKEMLSDFKQKNESTIYYWSKKPDTKEVRPKHSYIYFYEKWNWAIGTGFYLDDVKDLANKLKREMDEKLARDINSIVLWAFLLALFVSLFAYLLARKIRSMLEFYYHQLEEKNLHLEELNDTLDHKVKERTEKLNTLLTEVEALSVTDELTGLYNRRYYNEVIPKEINRAKRNDKFFVYLLLDLDHFKPYNDFYGHQKGDALLIRAATAMKQNMNRAGDYLFRIGGEEFVALFTTDNQEDAKILAQQIVDSVAQLNEPHVKNMPHGIATVSAGATCMHHEHGEITEETLYNRADTALYEAKASGRNRLVLAKSNHQERGDSE